MEKSRIVNEVARTVSAIVARDGEIRPSVLVDTAKPDDSPIHSAFEWNDDKAGHEYRLMQARQWIRRVQIIVEDEPQRLIHIPQIVTFDDDGEAIPPSQREGCYKPVSVVVESVDDYELALSQAKSQIASARRAYDELKDAYAKRKKQPQLKLENVPDFALADNGFVQIQTALG